MSFIRRIFRLLPAIVLMSGFARAAAGQQEKPVDPDSLTGGSRRFGLVINGFAAGNFNYNFNTDENNLESSALAVSLFRGLSDRVSFFGQVTVHKEESSPFVEPVGPARIRPLAFRRIAEEEGGSSFSTEIDNLQVSWAADPRRGLSIIFGKFDSPLAIERDDAPLNFQATSSFVFNFARPVKFTGLMARQTFSPKFEGYAILANGWDVDSDNNHAKTGALYGIWSPWPIAHFGLGVIHGAEKDGRTGDRRTTGVATILVQQTDSWVWGEEFVYGSEPHSEDCGAVKWFGDMFFTHHRLGKHWALTLRTDYFDDIEGSRTGQRQVLRSFTLSPQYLIGGGFFGLYRTLDRTSLRIPEVAVRLDLRFDRSTERVFASKTGQARRDDRSATLQVVYVF